MKIFFGGRGVRDTDAGSIRNSTAKSKANMIGDLGVFGRAYALYVLYVLFFTEPAVGGAVLDYLCGGRRAYPL